MNFDVLYYQCHVMLLSLIKITLMDTDIHIYFCAYAAMIICPLQVCMLSMDTVFVHSGRLFTGYLLTIKVTPMTAYLYTLFKLPQIYMHVDVY